LTLFEVDASPIVAIPSGVKLGCKQLSITILMEFVGFASLSFTSLYFSTFGIYVKRRVSALASMASTWKSSVKAFVIHVLSQLLVIIPSMSYTCVHVECNHPQI